ncbi:MAG: DUF5076 domain-containing protein [Betaproteobacteria bacterium]|nr:MAG: DUF5076 domain-containing protein [Betaproteobacteria bacterium]
MKTPFKCLARGSRKTGCSLNIGMWSTEGKPEAAAWGILLADVIRHLANAIREEHGVELDTTVHKVVESLLSELDQPTSAAHGSFNLGHS